MKYQCEACKEYFQHPAKQTESINEKQTVVINHMGIQGDTLETHRCPFCQSKKYHEAPEPQPTIESVYVYELTTGLQTELNELLAQGYKKVAGFAKQYHLEKPKEVQP